MPTNFRLSLFTTAAIVHAILAFYEIGMAYLAAWWIYLSVGIAYGVALMPLASGRRQSARLIAPFVICGSIAALYFVPWTSRKPFLRDLEKIHVGMTEAEVRHLMASYMEGTGWPAFPDGTSTNAAGTLTDLGSGAQYSTDASPGGELVIRNSLVFRHSNNGRFNSDWGIVSLSGGRVVRVEFSPD